MRFWKTYQKEKWQLTNCLSFLCFLLFTSCSVAQVKGSSEKIVVDAEGNGRFRKIQDAINSLPDSAATTWIIYIKNGTYNEKIFLAKHNISLVGESREGTVLTQSINRTAWRCDHPDDWGVATVNVDGNDITLENLTVINSFGFEYKGEEFVPCTSDSTGKKKLRKDDHQMALRTMRATRLKALNCRFAAFGGDTVSPWNTVNGMFYFKDCIMEGGVDFYCPRGWAWAENCRFITHSGNAAIWHDGSGNEDSKTVLKNCSFEGFNGFNLGRYHRDAQFYLLGCRFSSSMADRDIYLVPTNNTILWGRRVYYEDCHREGGDFSWFKNNLSTAIGSPRTETITVDWLFDGAWRPQTTK